MPDKISDNDIKKALEICAKAKNYSMCEEMRCPLYRECKIEYKSMEETIIPYSLAYINRLEAEIERLEKEVIEQKLKNNMLPETAKEIETNAYKEFAERLKEKSKFNMGLIYGKVVYFEDIDNCLKEMVGEDNG